MRIFLYCGFHRNPVPRTRVNKGKRKGRSPERRTPTQIATGSGYPAEDHDLFLEVPVEGLRVVDEVAQHLGVVCGGHDEGFLGPVIQDQLVGELAVFNLSLVAPVGVDVGDLSDLYTLLGVLLARGEPPRVSVTDEELLTYLVCRLMRDELPRIPYRRSSHNSCSTYSGE